VVGEEQAQEIDVDADAENAAALAQPALVDEDVIDEEPAVEEAAGEAVNEALSVDTAAAAIGDSVTDEAASLDDENVKDANE
jgi:hypothetical protein